MMRILDCLPPLYEDLLPGLFRRRIPTESLADCADCPMCRRPGEPQAPGVSYFEPDARCCTFYPSLPNYLAGALLADRSATHREGRRRVRALLHESEGAGPLALDPPRGYERLYARLGGRGFGRRRSLLCPYFRLGANDCSIWGFRNCVCATYFCQPVRGIPGAAFWRAVRRYLGVLEKSLASHALAVLDRPAEDGQSRPAVSRLRLRDWRDRDRERLYRESYAVVRGLNPREVARIGGEAARAALEVVRDSLRGMLTTTIPPRLCRNPTLRIRRRADRVYLEVPGHIAYCLHRPVWEALQRFDGTRENEWVARELHREQGLELSRGFLLALCRAGILGGIKPPGNPRL